MIAKFPYYTGEGIVDDPDSNKEWLIVSGLERVNIRPRKKKAWRDWGHPDIFLISSVDPDELSDALMVTGREVILHYESGKTLSVLFDNGVFLCNDDGKTIDRFD